MKPVPHTFKDVDPVSGKEVTCAQCPPGQFLRRRCTESTESVCEDCPPGSFTALWNYIGRCLRCGICGRNMVQHRVCQRDRDCACQCKPGYYYKERAGMCVRWAECGTGTGVTVPGSPVRNTECAPCANGTFSDRVSSESGCSAHSLCQAPGSKVILKGNAWHDLICAGSCEEACRHDGVDFLRRLLPSFFSHHSLSLRRLRHVHSKLPSADVTGKRRRSAVSGLNQDQLKARLDQWILESSPDHLRTLPQILIETGAVYTAERLTAKLTRIQSNIQQLCPQETSSKPGLNQVWTTAVPGLTQVWTTAAPGLNQD